MQKRMVFPIVILLFAELVGAFPTEYSDPQNGIERITDFETDNIHILRLQNFSALVVQEVSGLKKNFVVMQAQLADIQKELDELKSVSKIRVPEVSGLVSNNLNAITARLVGIESQLNSVHEKPIGVSSNNSLLLILNLVVLVGVFATFFFVQRIPFVDERALEKQHAQLHLNNAIAQALNSGISQAKVRETFVLQGWSSVFVDKALDAAVRQKYG